LRHDPDRKSYFNPIYCGGFSVMVCTGVISAESLSLTLETNDGPVHALSDVDLTIDKRESLSFISPSPE